MSAGPKLFLVMDMPVDSEDVWLKATVYRSYSDSDKEADSFKHYKRLVGMRGPAAQAQVSTCANRLWTALRKKGPGLTYEDLVNLAEAWEKGELDVH